MKSHDEEFAKTSFSSYLPNNIDTIWEDVCQSNEPPDYYLTIDNKRFAVEVTFLFDRVTKDGKQYPSLSISMSLLDFVKDLENLAKEMGILSGAYVVELSPLSSFYDIKENLMNKLLAYIQKTKDIEKYDEEVILDQSFEWLSIEKIHNNRRAINEIITFEPRWEGESKLEFCSLLRNTIQIKNNKLIDLPNPKILLIIDAFKYVDGQYWNEAITDIPEKNSFHTICRISGSGDTTILFSKYSAWIESY